jgi:hypothetical protein
VTALTLHESNERVGVHMRRTVTAGVLALVAAFSVAGAPAATAAGIEIAGPRYTYNYYSEPELQNWVGQRIVTRCPDVPVEEWGVQTPYYQRFTDWVQCP